MTTAANLVLPDAMTVPAMADLVATMQSIPSDVDTVHIDVAATTRWDLSGLQALVTFKRTLLQRGANCLWHGVCDNARSVAQLAGLRGELGWE